MVTDKVLRLSLLYQSTGLIPAALLLIPLPAAVPGKCAGGSPSACAPATRVGVHELVLGP